MTTHSIAMSSGTRLLIGTSKGQLLVYNVPHRQENPGRFKVDLQETKKVSLPTTTYTYTRLH